jgi:hypothetical protein
MISEDTDEYFSGFSNINNMFSYVQRVSGDSSKYSIIKPDLFKKYSITFANKELFLYDINSEGFYLMYEPFDTIHIYEKLYDRDFKIEELHRNNL